MAKDRLRQTLAALLVVLVAAAPLSGAVCTMACGDDGGRCCCESPDGLGTLQLTAESCCGPEASSPAVSNLSAERLTVGSPANFLFTAAADSFSDTGGSAEFEQGFTAPVREQARGRSSPLFLLNVSFLI